MLEIPSPSSLDCLKTAPNPYRLIMQLSHFLTFPIYLVTFYLLIFNIFQKSLLAYRKFLMWHTIGNLIFEFYISVFMLPVTYLPALVFRCAGALRFFSVSGVVQFYLLVGFVLHTVFSILHLFRFRFDVTITEMTFGKKLLARLFYLFYFFTSAASIFTIATMPRLIKNQNQLKAKLYEKNSDLPIEIFCYSTVIAPSLLDPVFGIIMLLMIVIVLICLSVVLFAFFQITKKLEQLSQHLSKKTIQLQTELLISIVVQAGIHGIMLAIPVFGFIYAIIFNLHDNGIAYALLILIAFHGSASTVGMIIFTKPLRLGIFKMFQALVPASTTKSIWKKPNLSSDASSNGKSIKI